MQEKLEKKKNQRGLFTQRGSLSRHSSLLQANKAKTAVEFQGFTNFHDWMYKTFSKKGTLFKGRHYLRKYGIFTKNIEIIRIIKLS